MVDLIGELKRRYRPGNRYNLMVGLIGSLVNRGYGRDYLYRMYREIRHLDDDDRSYIIDETIDRYKSGKRVRTLYSMKGDKDADALYLVISSMPVMEDISPDEDSMIERLKERLHVRGGSVDLEQVSVEMDRRLTPISYEYALSRGLDDQDIRKYGVRCGIELMSGRVVFPVYNGGCCVMVVGRSYIGSKRKYLTLGSSSAIWYSGPLAGSSVIVCEGVLSAISAHKHSGMLSAALLGSYVSFEHYISISKFDEIYLCFDPDVSDNKVNLVADSIGKEVRLIKLPEGKDPNDVDSSQFMSCLSTSKVRGPVDELSRRLSLVV